MALPHPNVLNLTSWILWVCGSTWIWNGDQSAINFGYCALHSEGTAIRVGARDCTWSFMTSPQAGAPTRPVPTSMAFLSIEPTFRGFLLDRVSSFVYAGSETLLTRSDQ